MHEFHVPTLKGTPGVFQRRVPNLTTSPGFRPYKMDLKYAISAQNFNRFFCYSLFSKWRFFQFCQHFWRQDKIFWDINIKFLEFEGNIKVNKPKEGFLKRSSFLALRTVYFFASLALCLRMFPCFIRDENLVKVAPNDCLCGPKILELSRQRCGVQSLFCETRIFEKERNCLYLKNGWS